MDLKEYCYSLSKDDLFKLALHLCENALFIWDEYSLHNALEYKDTVVGMRHKVRRQLLPDSIKYCKETYVSRIFKKRELNKLLEEYRDPIVSLQDSDWELPYPVRQIFYAVHNLLDGINERMTVFNEKTHYVSVNQAVDALTEDGSITFDEIKRLIYSE